MNPEVKAKWLEALRSGEYEQGKGQLAANGQFCCLGVLCEIAKSEGLIKSAPYDNGSVIYSNRMDDDVSSGWGYQSYLPPAVAQWAGLGNTNPEFVVDNTTDYLSNANDSGSTFDEIADIIEEYF